jgi:hypothetical protein
MLPPEFDTFLRTLAALRPKGHGAFFKLSPAERGEAKRRLAGVPEPQSITAEQRWRLARVKAYVRGEECSRWVPPDPEDPMEQMLAAVAKHNNAEREREIARQYKRLPA